VDIILNSQRTQIFGVDCITNLGIDVIQKSVIVVKSSQHFYASFAPIAAEVIYCVAPGTLMMDIARIPYQRVDKNKWPLVEDPFASQERNN
jgi:microcystin degradation protein MlrC